MIPAAAPTSPAAPAPLTPRQRDLLRRVAAEPLGALVSAGLPFVADRDDVRALRDAGLVVSNVDVVGRGAPYEIWLTEAGLRALAAEDRGKGLVR